MRTSSCACKVFIWYIIECITIPPPLQYEVTWICWNVVRDVLTNNLRIAPLKIRLLSYLYNILVLVMWRVLKRKYTYLPFNFSLDISLKYLNFCLLKMSRSYNLLRLDSCKIWKLTVSMSILDVRRNSLIIILDKHLFKCIHWLAFIQLSNA